MRLWRTQWRVLPKAACSFHPYNEYIARKDLVKDGLHLTSVYDNNLHSGCYASTIAELECPFCGRKTSKVHSIYEREIQDLPMQGKKVILFVLVGAAVDIRYTLNAGGAAILMLSLIHILNCLHQKITVFIHFY